MNTATQAVILFRELDHHQTDEELLCAKEAMTVITSRSLTLQGELVIGRYSVLPFYKELERDLAYNGSSLINTHREHRYVADLMSWSYDLQDMTPRTWFRLEDVPDSAYPVILKGETNSRKNKWKTHMYAADKHAALDVYLKLSDDVGLEGQNICIRKFVPLVTYMSDPISGQPVTEEFRIFVLDGEVIGSGYYWSSHIDQLPGGQPEASVVPPEFLRRVIDRVKDKIRFFVVDVAKTLSGEWVVVELNDGQMSGLSCVDPKKLYTNMRDVLKTGHHPLKMGH